MPDITTTVGQAESSVEISLVGGRTGTASNQIRDRIKELRRVKARELQSNPKNWRRHPKAQAAALGALLSEIGYADALLARELPDGQLMLIDGHLRAETTPQAEVPVLVLDVTEEEADKLLLTLDPLAAMAEADAERIKTLLASVKTADAAVLNLMRRTAGERLWAVLHPEQLSEAEVSPEHADQLRHKWCTAKGQLWQIEGHRLICVDSTEHNQLAPLWERTQARAQLIWTDPPYGVSYADKNARLNQSDRGNRIQRPIINDHVCAAEASARFRAGIEVAVSYCLPGASLYATVPGGHSLAGFIQALEAAGFTFKSTLVWLKNHFVLGMSDYHFRHELILYGWLPNGTHLWTGGRSQDSVFEVDRPHISALHPTTKPIELIARMLSNSSRPGDLVYDPFCGSGSTVIAAHQLGRVGYGCEIDPGYLAVSLERLSLLGLRPQLVSPG